MICKNCDSRIPEHSSSCPNCNKYPLVKDDYNVFKDNNFQIAKWWKRLLNYLLDLLFFYICIIIIGVIFAFISIPIFTQNKLIDIIISLIYYIIYYLITEMLFSRSIAKFITRTTVIRIDGKSVEFKNVLIRTVSRFIPFEALTFLSDRPIGWHDSLAKTYVVDKILISK